MQVFAKTHVSISLKYSGYITGSGDGIVTVQGKPASRNIHLLNTTTLAVERVQTSLSSGHYAFFGLSPDAEYLVIARDHKKEFEPFAWDYVKPANDLTIEQQQALWQTWQ